MSLIDRSRFVARLSGVIAVSLLSVAQASAAVVAANNCLPPIGPHFKYVGDNHINFQMPGLVVDLSNVVHAGFTNCLAPPQSGSQLETFGSSVAFDLSFNGGPAQPNVSSCEPLCGGARQFVKPAWTTLLRSTTRPGI